MSHVTTNAELPATFPALRERIEAVFIAGCIGASRAARVLLCLPPTMREACRDLWRAGLELSIDDPSARPTEEPLPHTDGRFGLAITAGCLERVAPERVEPLLRELVRVTRGGHVVHVEPVATGTDGALPLAAAPDARWAHPLPEIYRRLGLAAERLASLSSAHAVCRVAVGAEGPAPDVAVLARALQRVDGQAAEQADAVAQAEALRKQVWALQWQVQQFEQARHRFDEASAQIQRIAMSDAAMQRALERILAGGQ